MVEKDGPLVYILYSEILDQFYVGQTLDFHLRLLQHNEKSFLGSFTSRTSDWRVVLTVRCRSKTQALKIEAQIKRMKSRKYILDLMNYPAIVQKLKVRYPN